MPKYTIVQATETPQLNGDTNAAPWNVAQAIAIDQYPWYERGAKQATVARVMYDANALYLHFVCEDKHIDSKVTDLNRGVCLDSCVEFFAMFDPETGLHYFNVEMNCCGTLLLGFGDRRQGRIHISPEQAETIRIETSVSGPTKDESSDDDGWWLAAAVPFDTLSEFTGRSIRPTQGDLWRGNFYRCGGVTEDQHASWSPIALPAVDFHCPEYFSEISFG